VWGKDVQKLECANHVCKCLRSSLEKLVDSSPMYKGKNRLTKFLTRVGLTNSVRCAIHMRSKELDKIGAIKQLDHDIRNSIYHILGNHDRCSDFCKARPTQAQMSSSTSCDAQKCDDIDEPVEDSIPSIIEGISSVWAECTSLEAEEESRRASICTTTDIDTMMPRDINILLNRVASKSSRLLGNSTTNLAESWMAI